MTYEALLYLSEGIVHTLTLNCSLGADKRERIVSLFELDVTNSAFEISPGCCFVYISSTSRLSRVALCTLLSITSTLGSAVIQIIHLNSHVEYTSRITNYVAKLADMSSYAFGYRFLMCLTVTFDRSKYPKLSSNMPLTIRFKHTLGRSFPSEMFIARFKSIAHIRPSLLSAILVNDFTSAFACLSRCGMMQGLFNLTYLTVCNSELALCTLHPTDGRGDE